jgi:hypothetical protein
MENVSHIEMIANQSGKFHEKERFQENIEPGNMTPNNEREASYKCGKLPGSVGKRSMKMRTIRNCEDAIRELI